MTHTKHEPKGGQTELAKGAKGIHGDGHHAGTITEIRKHEHGEHAIVTVRHGYGPRQKKGEEHHAMPVAHKHSSVMVPMAHADHYHVGQRVGVGIAAMNDDRVPGESHEDPETGSDAEESPQGEAYDDVIMNLRKHGKKR